MRIDLFSDTVCPWCRIGKRHLFNDRLAFSGAQPPEAIRRVLQQAAADHPHPQ